MNYIQSFNRYEKKYLLSSGQYDKLMQAAEKIITPDSYGKHTICNIYLDTDDYFFIRNSIEKPVYKEKLRIRSYGIPDGSSKVFLEIKKKFKGVVYKRRFSAKENTQGEFFLSVFKKILCTYFCRLQLEIFSLIKYDIITRKNLFS